MKLNISYPQQAVSKKFLIEDEQKMKALHDLRITDEVNGDILGDQFKGYVFKITGGSDKQGFAMVQGVLTSERVRLLLGEGHQAFQFHRRQKRVATRKRKSVRGCITSAESALINMVIVKKGDKDIPGLTEEGAALPNRMGPKRAGKIRKLWNLEKKDDVRQYVIRRVIPKKEGSKRKKDRVIVPKIQRLVTPKKVARAARKERVQKVALQKSKDAKEAYEKMIAAKREATRSKRLSKLSKKRDDKKPEPAKKDAKKADPKKAAPVKKAAAAAAPAKAAPKAAAQPAAKKAEKKAAAPAKAAPKKK